MLCGMWILCPGILCAINLPTVSPSVSPAAPPLVSLLLPVWNRTVTLMCLVCLVLCAWRQDLCLLCFTEWQHRWDNYYLPHSCDCGSGHNCGCGAWSVQVQNKKYQVKCRQWVFLTTEWHQLWLEVHMPLPFCSICTVVYDHMTCFCIKGTVYYADTQVTSTAVTTQAPLTAPYMAFWQY